MTNLRNHSGFWLAAPAEVSLARFEAAHGVIPITSAGRTVGEQQTLINRWDKGGSANRPPNLYEPARPAALSRHVFQGGNAIDTRGNGIALMHKFGQDFGWFFNYAYDLVHFEYNSTRDKHKGTTTASVGGSTVIPKFNATIASRQNFFNHYRGEHLIVDGLWGPATLAAYKRYQTFLRKFGYKGKIDGIWGPGTGAAHAAYFKTLK